MLYLNCPCAGFMSKQPDSCRGSFVDLYIYWSAVDVGKDLLRCQDVPDYRLAAIQVLELSSAPGLLIGCEHELPDLLGISQ